MMNTFTRLIRLIGLVLIVGSIGYLWIINQPHTQSSSPSLTSKPKEGAAYRLTSVEVNAQDCSLNIQTTTRPVIVKTKFEPGISRCEEFLIAIPSPSGKIVAYEDLAGGIDSWLKIYSAEFNESIGVEILGASSILSMAFLPDDKLAVLHGYGLTSERWLRIYDLPQLLNQYPDNLSSKKTTDIIQFDEIAVSRSTSILDLPKSQESYHYLAVKEDKLQLFGSKGIGTKVLAEFDISQI